MVCNSNEVVFVHRDDLRCTTLVSNRFMKLLASCHQADFVSL
jgi:hypothetical protein